MLKGIDMITASIIYSWLPWSEYTLNLNYDQTDKKMEIGKQGGKGVRGGREREE